MNDGKTGLAHKGTRFFLIFIISLAAMAMPACNPDETPQTARDLREKNAWTVLIYMSGSDLESAEGIASRSLLEMAWAGAPEGSCVVVATGGSPYWHINKDPGRPEGFPGINPACIGYYKLDGNNFIQEAASPCSSMGNPETLSTFLSWGTETHPADRYILVFWGHGAGPLAGVCADELYGGDMLTLPEIKEALSDSGTVLEVAGFDACLMAGIETAAILEDSCQYMVASQEWEPGGGWDYAGLMEDLREIPEADGIKLGEMISDRYIDKCRRDGTGRMSTLSVTDLSKTPELINACEKFAENLLLSSENTDSLRKTAEAVSKTESYGGNTDFEGYTDTVDILGLAEGCSNLYKKDSEAMSEALRKTVVYETHGDGRHGSHGLSMFYPLYTDSKVIETYKEIGGTPAMAAYAAILAGCWDPGKWGCFTLSSGKDASQLVPVQPEDIAIKFSQYTDEGWLRMDIKEGLSALSEAACELYYKDPGTGLYLCFGSSGTLEDLGGGSYRDGFDGTWPAIGGQYVCAEFIGTDGDQQLYAVPALINGKRASIRALRDAHGWRVLGAYSETGNRGISPLKYGDRLQFLFSICRPDGSPAGTVFAGSAEWALGTSMENLKMGDSEFLYMFRVKDVFGRVNYGTPVRLDILDNEVRISG